MTPTSTERGREVRARILGAAVVLITELGWNGVSTRNLAERAGVRPGLIHYHFTSLHALLREATIDAMNGIVEATTPLLAEIGDLDAGLDAMVQAVGGYAEDEPASLLFTEAYLAATRDPELRTRMDALIDRFRTELAAWLADGGHPTPDDTATVLVAALDGLVLHRAINPGLDLTAAARVLRLLLHP